MRIMINGFGRIGRQAFKNAIDDAKLEVVRINDVADAETLAYLLKYDTTYGVWNRDVRAGEGEIRVDGKAFAVSNIKNPGELPHSDDGTEVVLEAAGLFRKREDAQKHIDAGAKKVLITAPAKSPIDGNYILGVNEDQYNKDAHHIISIGSCTTNSLAPMAKVPHEAFGIQQGLMTTVHAYTSSQDLQDGPEKKLTRGRAAAENIVPTTTGAAEMIGKIIPDLDCKLDGMALRVPVICGSITDLVCRLEKKASVDEVNEAFRKYAEGRGKGVLTLTQAPLVSHDIVGNPFSCMIAPDHTQVIEGTLVKVLGWYDNEWAFSKRLIDMTKRMV